MSSANVEHDEIVYPSSDGQPMAETPEHLLLMVALISALRHYFKSHRDVYVIGNMFLYYEKGNPGARRAPDIMVVKGIDPKVRRRSFKTWVEGTVPAAVIELTSAETAQEDQEIKLHLYQKLGVREYIMFDPLNEYLPRQLMGYRLVGQRYKELAPDDEEALVSDELGLRLVPNGTDLVLIDCKTGQRLLVPDELYELAEELKLQATDAVEELRRLEQAFQTERRRAEEEKQRAEREKQQASQVMQRAEQERQRADQEKQRADQEKQRAEQEKQRADSLAAELERLRAQLKHPPG